VARRHTLKLRELRRIRLRFVVILAGMAAVTFLILTYLAIRVFIDPNTIRWLDFVSLCFYGLASIVMTLAQIAFLRHLSLRAGRRIETLTYTDDLTGLANRRHVAKFLSEELREAQLARNVLSLLFVDLDGLKLINDAHGHTAGDLVLHAVGHSLKDAVREADFVGRIGGDEFVVILPDTDSQCASVVAHRIAERLAAITLTRDREAISGLTASIGISAYPANAQDRRALIEDADRAMYAAKKSGKGSIVISIARPAGPEPAASGRGLDTFAEEIRSLVGRTKAPAPDADTDADDAEGAAHV
jgi:diguanylate cyclase (GGDEF)-like protein